MKSEAIRYAPAPDKVPGTIPGTFEKKGARHLFLKKLDIDNNNGYYYYYEEGSDRWG
jgi:hypothetical protein